MPDRVAVNRAAALSVALLTLSACGPSLEEAHSAWQREHPDSYVFEYQRNCVCPGTGLWWRITVRRDTVVTAALVDSSDVATRNLGASLGMHPTITQMFDGITAFAHRPHTWTRVHYDAKWHFPSDARGDVTNRVGLGFHFYVRNFHPTP
jgi:Family of unknown function (DUF6174)